ncbi:hypothetical protein [Coprothermobacter platensis]|uniref:hypothetical protein n=1 Tax=Coprothermobacter platensis TaxID=108819 RepID=UPI001FE19967|nr:hypothetical protein [Coprothermobacter platensis]
MIETAILGHLFLSLPAICNASLSLAYVVLQKAGLTQEVLAIMEHVRWEKSLG